MRKPKKEIIDPRTLTKPGHYLKTEPSVAEEESVSSFFSLRDLLMTVLILLGSITVTAVVYLHPGKSQIGPKMTTHLPTTEEFKKIVAQHSLGYDPAKFEEVSDDNSESDKSEPVKSEPTAEEN